MHRKQSHKISAAVFIFVKKVLYYKNFLKSLPMRRFSFGQKSFKRDRIYFLISIIAIATTLVVSLPSPKVRAAAETLNCDGNSRTISVGTYTDATGNQFTSGADLTLAQGSGSCTFTITQLGNASAIELASLNIQSGVTLTHDAAVTTDGTYNKIELDVTGDVVVESGASIDVSAKGLASDGGSVYGYGMYDGVISNSFGYASSQGSGGSHGGPGGSYTDFSFGAAVLTQYDSISNPIYPGSSGSWFTALAKGGGVVRITAANVTVSGTIYANATTLGFAGEGAGGTIYLNASGNISGDGTLTANGGGGVTSYGGGGGGRIALHYANISSGFTLQAKGGDVSGSGEDGGAGTIYKKPSAQTYGDLIVDNGGVDSLYYATELPYSPSIPTSDRVATYANGYVFNSVTVSNNGVLNIPTSLDSTGDGTLSRSRKFYIVNACDASALDTSNANGQIQWGLASVSDPSLSGSNYTCIEPQYIMEFTLTTSTASESVTSGNIEIIAIGPAPTTTFVDYTVNLTSTTATGGGVDFTLANGTASFAAGDTTTTISFTVVNDGDMESDEDIVVELSNPVNGVVGLASAHTYTIEDNDTPGITSDVGSGVNVTEGSDTLDTYTLVLDALPLATVTIHISSDDQVTTTVESIEFTTANWDTPQSISVGSLNDSIAESSHSGTISHSVSSTDLGYEGLVVDDVSVSISDNDFAGATVSQSGGSTIVSENGVTDTYTLVLNTLPIAPVTISISPNDEVTVSTSSIVFNTSTWNVPQTITVTAVDDLDSDQWDGISISHSSTSDDPQYNAIFIGGIFGTVIDNESPAVTITASGGSTNIREGGVVDTFTVNLETQPSDDVIIILDDGSEMTASPSELTFTALNWQALQTVTLTAIDDETFEGSENTSVSFTASSTDSNYHNISINSVSVTVYDNDGITVTESAGSTNIVEGGATDSFDVVLDENPFSNVTISLTTSTQYSLSTTTLYFHSDDWDTPQTVTLTAVDDVDVEGNHTATVSSSISTFAFTYGGTVMENVTVNITDNDEPVAGVTVTPSSGTTELTEAGQTDTYTVVLDTMPAADVTISVTPDNQSTVSSSSLIFTAINWDTAQTVTVTAVNDFIAEGGHTSTISHVATSADGDYEAIAIDDVVATITDNDTAGITVSTISASTTEAGVTSTFTVVLESEPTEDVIIPLSSSDATEGTISTSSLTFNPANWDTVRTVVVTGIDDDIDDGNIAYTINITATSSTDPNYHNINPTDVSVENMDNDTIGVTITESDGSTTVSEAGFTDTYTLVLATEPTFDVTVEISADSQSTVSTSSIVFSTENWDTPQTITVTADNDNIDEDSPHTSTITHDATSADASYEDVAISSVTVNITDNDIAGVTVSPLFVTTTEAGVTSTFTVVLDSRPVEDVQINLSVTDVDEASLSSSTLIFNPSNWSTERTIIVTGLDDLLIDGNGEYIVVIGPVSSTDPNYAVINPTDVTGVNIDDDVAGITVGALSGNTSEAGGTATFTLVLDTEPTENVFIGISSSDITEGTVSTSSVTFTSENWDTPQTITVTGVNDSVDDGDVAYTIVIDASTSADVAYDGIDPNNIAVTNTDNDTAGITVSSENVDTTEGGVTDTYSLVLDTEPTATVNFVLSVDAQSSVSTSSFSFTSANWNTPQTITVTAVNDNVDDLVSTSSISHTVSSADPNYDDFVVSSVINTITDNDTAGFTISAISGNTSEGGGTATYNLVLTSQPTANVTIPVASNNTDEGTVSTSSIVFTAGSWNIARTITVTGVDDDTVDGNINFSVIHSAVTSDDSNYNGLNPDDVNVTNTDDDIAQVILTQSGGTTTLSENAGTDTYTIVLNSEPSDSVTVNITAGDGITLSTSSILFTVASWDTAQTITITGIDNADVDGDRTSTLSHVALSDDADYGGIEIDDLTVNITDDDTPEEEVPGTSHNGGSGNSAPSTPSDSTVDTPAEDSSTVPFVPAEETLTLVDTQRQQIVIGEAVHHVTRVSATDLVATIILESDPITLTLQKNKIKRIDTDGDKKVDLSVTYLGLVNGTPKFVFATIAPVETIVDPAPVEPVDTVGPKQCLLLKGNPYKVEGSPAVYLVDVAHNLDGSVNLNIPCAKRAFINADLYFTYFESWKNIRTVDPQLLAEIPNDALLSIPVGPRRTLTTGSLIKMIDDPKVYLVLGAQKHWIQTEVIFRTLGYLFSWVDEVTRDTLNSFGEGSAIDKPVRPAGTIIRYPQSDTLYRIVNKGSVLDKEEVIPTEGLSNYNKERIVTVSGSEVYPRNSEAPSARLVQLNRFLSVGSTGQDVLALQNILKDLGYLTATPNGYFGPATFEAVKQFQQDRGIDVRGYVGPATRDALNNL